MTDLIAVKPKAQVHVDSQILNQVQAPPQASVQTPGLKVVGQRPIRPDGADKVMGRANFGADLRLPGMLTGKVKRSPHAHACDACRAVCGWSG